MSKLIVVGKKGAYDKKGNWIIPFKYDDVGSLNGGIYYACMNDKKKGNEYHLYTSKGQLEYPKRIVNIQCDTNKNLVAVYTIGGEVEFVEVDYKNNLLKTIYNKSVVSVDIQTDNLFFLTTAEGTNELFSRKQKKVIASFDEEKHFVEANENGFVCRNGIEKSFWNLSDKKILDGFHNIKMYNDFLICIDKTLFYQLYSFKGKQLNPCRYSGNELVDGIVPCRTQIDGEKVWLFITNSKIIGSDDLSERLETADGTCLIWTLEQGEPITVFEDISNAILTEKNKQTLYKFEKTAKGTIVANIVFEAGTIQRIPNSDNLFEVWKGRKRGVCDGNGNLIIPLKWKLAKKSYERIGDIDH